MNSMIFNVTKKVSLLNDELELVQKKVDKNFLHSYEWGYLDDMYLLNQRIAIMEDFACSMERKQQNDEEAGLPVYEYDIFKSLYEGLVQYYLGMEIGRSSLAASNKASELRMKAVILSINELKWYL